VLAAKEAAEAGRWLQLGHDGSEINQISTLTCNVKLSNGEDRSDIKDLSLRGCYYTRGTTAKLELEAMNAIIDNGQSKLRLWWDTYEMLFGDNPLGSEEEDSSGSDSDEGGGGMDTAHRMYWWKGGGTTGCNAYSSSRRSTQTCCKTKGTKR
jgi:hypothetical protein